MGRPHAARLQYEQFLIAIDAEAMRPRLLEALGAGGDESCTVVDAKLEPGQPAVVLYDLGGRLVHGTVPADGADDPQQRLSRGVHLSVFPTDPALAGLPFVVDHRHLAETLETGLLQRDITVVRAQSRLLRYRPGRRATFLVEAELRRGGADASTQLVAKVYHDPAKAAAVADEGQILSGSVTVPPLVLAPIVAHAAHRAVVFQGHLPGHPLVVDLGADPATGRTADLHRAARALAAFHALTVPAGRPRPLERELARFVARSTGVRSVDEASGDHLMSLAHRLLAHPRPTARASLVHGDCKPSQFLVQDAAVALLDLDHCGLADPAYDVGNLVASLRQQAVQHDPTRLETALRLGDEFVAAYRSADRVGQGGDLPGRIAFYTAVALMRKALRAFARSPHSPLPHRLVDEAHRGLDRLRRDRS